MEADQLERYARQIVLKEIGGAGQQALGRTRVLIVGLVALAARRAFILRRQVLGILVSLMMMMWIYPICTAKSSSAR